MITKNTIFHRLSTLSATCVHNNNVLHKYSQMTRSGVLTSIRCPKGCRWIQETRLSKEPSAQRPHCVEQINHPTDKTASSFSTTIPHRVLQKVDNTASRRREKIMAPAYLTLKIWKKKIKTSKIGFASSSPDPQSKLALNYEWRRTHSNL